MKIRIEPYKRWSGGAKALGKKAGILRATTSQVRKHGDFDIIINWGSSQRRFEGEYINTPTAVSAASCKLDAANIFASAGVPQPPFDRDIEIAKGWLSGGTGVVARTLLRASAGRGIVLCTPENGQKLPKAPMYTQYVPKRDEYRVHVWKGEVIDEQQKKRRHDTPDSEVNWQIRNHDNGFVFTRDGVSVPDCVIAASIAAVGALGLDFGAVDLGYNEKRGEAVVYEVNTAPGLEGTTIDKYYKAVCKTFPAIQSGIYKRRRDGIMPKLRRRKRRVQSLRRVT